MSLSQTEPVASVRTGLGKKKTMSVGMPEGIWLTKFGVMVRDYFGHVPYHVGSSLMSKEWRDVDVRLIMPDDEFIAHFGDIHRSSETDPKLGAVTLAFAALGARITGLPIDFQIQPLSWANKCYGHHPRSALLEVDYPANNDH